MHSIMRTHLTYVCVFTYVPVGGYMRWRWRSAVISCKIGSDPLSGPFSRWFRGFPNDLQFVYECRGINIIRREEIIPKANTFTRNETSSSSLLAPEDIACLADVRVRLFPMCHMQIDKSIPVVTTYRTVIRWSHM